MIGAKLVLLRRLGGAVFVVCFPMPFANPTEARLFSVYSNKPTVFWFNIQVSEEHFQVLVSMTAGFQGCDVTILVPVVTAPFATQRCYITAHWSWFCFQFL